ALLSAQPDAQLSRILQKPLKRFTPATITEPARLREDISRTRRVGYVLSVDDLVQGAAGIGCVLIDHRGEAAASISIGGLKDRFVGKEAEVLRQAVVNAARRISGLLGGSEAQTAATG